MTSSAHEISDNSEVDEEQRPSKTQLQTSSPPGGGSSPGLINPNLPYGVSPQNGGQTMVQGVYPYLDPYYRSIPSSYDPQSYPTQPYGAQPLVHLQLMGIQHAGVPLPSDAVEEPVYVNAKQYHGILRRRQSRAKRELESKNLKSRKPYLHESRHLHALRRARGCGGRFLNSKNNDQAQPDEQDKSQSNINLNSERSD